jgi:organic radical activating enzyme
MKTFCPLPWNSINLRNNGDLRICCNTNSYSPQRGIMKHEDGTPYNAGKDDFNEARNAEILKDVRSSMLKDEWHPECERCRQEEINGITSRRQYESEDWDITKERAIEITMEDGTLDVEEQPIEFFDIRYGNFCNLKCRMCGPTDSHMWYSDFVKVHNTTSYKDTHDRIELIQLPNSTKWTTDQYDWFKNADHYWEQFEKYCVNAKKLYIVGGEPLIIPEHLESLQRLVDSGRAHEIEIEYNTNLTNVTQKYLDLWENFKQIRIGASVDGYGDVFDYQRTPANWKSVYANMKKLNDNRNINLKCWFTFTITPYNVYHLPEFMKWKLTESELDRFNPITGPRPTVTQHMCHSPKYFNIKVLPQYFKDEIEEHYDIYKQWVKSSDFSEKVKKHFIYVLDSTIKFMQSEDYSEEWLEEFISMTNKLDEVRGQDIVDIVPEYEELFR